MYPIAAEKKNYLIQVGENATVKLITKDNNMDNLNKISWGITDASIITTPVIEGKKTATFRGVKAGTTELLIQYPNSSQVVEKVFVSVVENNIIDFTKKVYTENIIGLRKGAEKDTSVVTSGFTSSEEADLLWETTNSNLVEIVSQSGKTARIKAKENATLNGECYVTVSYGNWLKRKILVYVCETDEQVQNYKAMNMENQYVRMGKGEKVILPVYYAPNKPQGDTVWEDRYGNGVVSFESREQGAKIEVTGLQEGVAVLEANNLNKSNPYFPLELYIEVSNNYVGIPVIDPLLKRLTTGKTVYLLNPQEREKQVEIQVSAIGMNPQEIGAIRWEAEDKTLIKVSPNGDKCIIMSNGLEGETNLRVSSAVANVIDIKIICDINARMDGGEPYIYFEDLVRLGYGEEKEYTVTLANSSGYNPEYFTVICDKADILDAKMAGSTLHMKGVKPGQAKMVLSHRDAVFKKEVIVIVTTTADGLIYLTTKENFNMLKPGEYKTISVEMVGYTDNIANNYKWELDEGNESIVEVNPNGVTAYVVAKMTGVGKTARIKVTNKFTEGGYPLYIYVRVSEVGVKVPYITMEQNIICIKEGSTMTVYAQIVNGDASMHHAFTWDNKNKDIVQVIGTGNTAMVIGKTVGVARVRLSNALCMNELEFIVIVEKDMTESGIYITTENLLIEMKPTEGVRSITARLVGGNPEDVYGFKWEVAEEYSEEKYADGTNKKVVDMTAGADRAYIRPVNEGEATIRVTHPRTSYRLDIKVDIKLSRVIEFKQRSAQVNTGDTVMLSVESPTGTRVIYESSDNTKAVVSGTNKMCIVEGLKKGTVILTARDATGRLSDEIMLLVNETEINDYGIISTEGNFITLNTNDIEGTSVKAEVKGNKSNGQPFVEDDSRNIIWEIVTPGGEDIIEMSKKDAGNNRRSIGEQVVITPKRNGAGEVEIHLKHPDLRVGYIKRFYVRVEMSEVIFKLSRTLIVTSVNGSMETLTAEIPNTLVNWDTDVEWKIEQDSSKPVIQKVVIANDNSLLFLPLENNGSAVIAVTYKNTTTRRCTVIVQSKPAINNVPINETLLLGESKSIEYNVNPKTSDVSVSVHDGDMVRTNHYYGEDPSGKTGNNTLIITGLKVGYTFVELSIYNAESGEIKRQIMITITDERNFSFLDSKPIRITPKNGELRYGDVDSYELGGTIKYRIENSQIGKDVLLPDNNTIMTSPTYSRHPFLLEKDTKLPSNEVSNVVQGVKLLHYGSKDYFEDGCYTIRLQSTLEEMTTIEKKIFIYYPRIEFDYNLVLQGAYATETDGMNYTIYNNNNSNLKYWNIRTKPNILKMKSRMDENGYKAIYLVDGERVVLRLDRSPEYKGGDSFKFKGIVFNAYPNMRNWEFSSGAKKSFSIDANAENTNRIIGVELSSYIKGDGIIKYQIDKDILEDTEYLGELSVKYEYYNGGEQPTVFIDRILVFGEIRSR